MIVMERLPRETGREFALRNLRENIIQLKLEPGTMLSENELATAMGLSRTPVREALLELSKVNIVEVYPQKGSAISLIDDEQVEESLFMREVLERAVVERCCQVATPEDIKKLREHVDLQRYYMQRTCTEHQYLQMDNEFHQMLFMVAGKPHVFDMMRNMAIHLDRIRALTLNNIPQTDVIEKHALIVDAIEKGDVEGGMTHMKQHITRFHTVDEELHSRFASYYK